MQPRIIIDPIIFALQRSGGISTLWGDTLRMLLHERHDVALLDCFGKEKENIAFSRDMVPSDALLAATWRDRLRYLDPQVKLSQRALFHSTYYRICPDALAINITTLHDFTYEHCIGGVAGWVHTRRKRHAVLHSDAIVCVSQATRADLLRYIPQADRSKTHVIHNPLTPGIGKLADGDTQLSALPFDGYYLLYVGSRATYKNFGLAVAGASQAGIPLVIAGSPLTPKEEAMLRNSGARCRVDVYPDVKRLNALYNGAQALLYPSSYEGFGMPVVEAQAAGCPVIALDIPAVAEVSGGAALLLTGPTLAQMSDALRRLDDDSNRNEIIAAGLQNSQKYTREAYIKKLTALYDSLLNTKG